MDTPDFLWIFGWAYEPPTHRNNRKEQKEKAGKKGINTFMESPPEGKIQKEYFI